MVRIVYIDEVVYFEGIILGTAYGEVALPFIYQEGDGASDLLGVPFVREALLEGHESAVSLFFDAGRHVIGVGVTVCAFFVGVEEGANPFQPIGFEELQQLFEVGFRFAGEAHNEGGAEYNARHFFSDGVEEGFGSGPG